MAASIISQVLDIRDDVIRESLSDFQNVEHRLEKFITISGVDYINDSKAPVQSVPDQSLLSKDSFHIFLEY